MSKWLMLLNTDEYRNKYHFAYDNRTAIRENAWE